MSWMVVLDGESLLMTMVLHLVIKCLDNCCTFTFLEHSLQVTTRLPRIAMVMGLGDCIWSLLSGWS
jgi:hypothetical protein